MIKLNFPVVNYPFLDSNISSSLAYSVYMSQLIVTIFEIL